MSNSKYIFCALTLLLAVSCCWEARGQSLRTRDEGRGNYGIDENLENVSANPFASDDDQEGMQQRDTLLPRQRLPLESYFFDIETRGQNMIRWTVDTWENAIRQHQIDTSLNMFQVDLYYNKHGVGDINIGHQAGPSVPTNYDDRKPHRDFQMSEPFYAYIFTPESAPFYNVKHAFTQFGYFTSGQKSVSEDNLTVIHAQNISPSTGFNVNYIQPSIKNRLENQATKHTNASFAFSHTGKRYSLHTGMIISRISNRSNGGLIYDQDIDNLNIELTQNMPVRLTDAKNRYRNTSFYAVQSYGIPFVRLGDDDFSMDNVPAVFFGHSIEWTKWTRSYTDTREGAIFRQRVDYYDEDSEVRDVEYYENWYFNPVATRDSLAESRLSNRVFMQLQPWDRNGIVGTVNAGVGVDNHSFHYFTPESYISGRHNNIKKSSYYAYGSVEGKFRRYFDWRGNIKFVPFGYRNGDIEVGAEARVVVYADGHPIALKGAMEHSRLEPSFWFQTYSSNHFIWSNSFEKENTTRFEISLTADDWDAEVRLTQNIVENKTYFGRNATPEQNAGSTSVTGLYARKDFRLGGFHLNHRVLLQWSTNDEVVPVPMFTGFISYFFELSVVKDVLTVRLGLDGRYNTKYYAPGYNPGLGQFYNQREKEYGNFFVVDAFMAAKWKRMNILLKYEHINESLFDNSGFFSTAHYPLGKGMFKVGLTWNFYN